MDYIKSLFSEEAEELNVVVTDKDSILKSTSGYLFYDLASITEKYREKEREEKKKELKILRQELYDYFNTPEGESSMKNIITPVIKNMYEEASKGKDVLIINTSEMSKENKDILEKFLKICKGIESDTVNNPDGFIVKWEYRERSSRKVDPLKLLGL